MTVAQVQTERLKALVNNPNKTQSESYELRLLGSLKYGWGFSSYSVEEVNDILKALGRIQSLLKSSKKLCTR